MNIRVMNTRRAPRRALLGLAVSICIASTAHAQERISLSNQNMAVYVELLGLDSDQIEKIRDFHKQYLADRKKGRRPHPDATQALWDAKRLGKDMAKANKRWLARYAESVEQLEIIEASLFNDIRLMLSDEQAERWDRVARQRRRDTTQGGGRYRVRSLNLITITESVVGERDLGQDIAAALLQYEVDLDHALIEVGNVTDLEKPKWTAWELMKINSDSKDLFRMTKEDEFHRIEQLKRQSVTRMREVNARHARIIRSLLPKDLAETFRGKVNLQTFSAVFRQSRIEEFFDIADALDDRTESQHQWISELRTSHARERAAADELWAAAIMDNEDKKTDAEENLKKARQARKDVDIRFGTKLMKLLTDAQQERLLTSR